MTAPTFSVPAGSVAHRVLAALSEDREAPSTLDALVRALPSLTRDHISVTLTVLIRRGAVERVGRGKYVRLVGEVRS